MCSAVKVKLTNISKSFFQELIHYTLIRELAALFRFPQSGKFANEKCDRFAGNVGGEISIAYATYIMQIMS